MTKWHRAYIQNAQRELAHGTTRKQIDTLGIRAKEKKVLDVGCGAGNLLTALATDAPELLVGVDIDAVFLAHCKKDRFPLLQATLPHLPFADETFELVTCFLVMPHVPDDSAALTELARVLKPGGTLAISGHGMGFPLSHLKRFKPKPLIMYLASLIYKITGRKWIRNTLQSEKKMCDTLGSIGVVPMMRFCPKKTLGCVGTYWIRGKKVASRQGKALLLEEGNHQRYEP